MRTLLLCLFFGVLVSIAGGLAQNPAAKTVLTVPTFTGSFVTNGRQYSYTMAGKNPELGGTTTIPTVVVPLSFTFDARGGLGGPRVSMKVQSILP